MKSTDSFEGVKSGMADMSFIIPAYFPGKFPVINLLQLPFGASTSAGASQIAWSMYEKFPEMRQMFDGFKVVSLWTTEPMYLHGAKKNYKTLDDFAGQQIRASAGAATDLANGLGGNAVFIGMGETYQNLQKGVVDSVITPSEGAMGFRIYEVAPYTTHFPGVPAVHMVVMNQKVWDSMPADIQQALNGVFGVNLMKKAAAVADMAAKDMPVKVKEAGLELHEYTVPNDELAKWVEKAGTPMRKAWLDSVAAAGVTNGQEMLDEYLKIAATVK
jgi:TRAP-type C4-dicarboxylate transport system substrate-binding protein